MYIVRSSRAFVWRECMCRIAQVPGQMFVDREVMVSGGSSSKVVEP